MSMEYYFQGHDFVIENYADKPPFTDFLSGVAGVDGRPLWAFFCNRGQGIAGFGVRGKSNPVMEFSPAEIAYETAPRAGFRTFLKIDGKYCEPFKVLGKKKTKMLIRRSGFAIEENAAGKYNVRVEYFGVPHENYAALARIVTYTNLSDTTQSVEMLDGLARILPFGMDNFGFKATGNLLKSWACVEGVNEGYVFTRMRSSSADTSKVSEVVGGNFFVAACSAGKVKTVADPAVVFGTDRTKTEATAFIKHGVTDEILSSQNTENEFACAFMHTQVSVQPKCSVTVAEISGYAYSRKCIKAFAENFKVADALKMRERAESLTESIASVPETHTAYPLFDEYIKQSYFDNVLRGGMPIAVGDKAYYVYSRKHGDPERDYNDFVVEPQAYSCGNGNFRDVAQNRRNDIFFTPVCGAENVKYFFSLLQTDGYNPLSVCGVKFRYAAPVPEKYEKHKEFLSGEFTLGELCGKIGTSDEKEIGEILKGCESVYKAAFSEGYWTDHFVYLIDLVTSYLSVYPDKKDELLYRTPLMWFKSGARVLPAKDKTVLVGDKVRRYNSVVKCGSDGWATTAGGEYYKTSLAAKLLFLSAIKLATLDPLGAGIDMEADRPGWNDATNGLPAIFGSNVADSLELLRLIGITKRLLSGGEIEWCAEQNELFENLFALLKADVNHTEFYFKSNEIKEDYREKIYARLGGDIVSVSAEKAIEFLTLAEKRLKTGVERAKALNGEVYPTYLRFEATDYSYIKEDGKVKCAGGLPCVKVKAFKPTALPAFSEGIAKGLMLGERDLYFKAINSDLYDRTLKVFKTSVSLSEESREIGRLRSFPAGWLERESCFLHMHYKVLLSLLHAGLYREFFKEIKTGLVPNMNPARYGRSTVQNSSFIVTANHSDKNKLGKGYQARLTGANAEVLSMWRILMGVNRPFTTDGGELKFELTPVLTKDFFNNGHVEFTLFGSTKITYINSGGDAINVKPKQYVLKTQKGIIAVDEVKGELAESVRAGEIKEIEVTL